LNDKDSILEALYETSTVSTQASREEQQEDSNLPPAGHSHSFTARPFIFRAIAFIQRTWLDLQTAINQGFASKLHLERMVAQLYASLFKQLYELHSDLASGEFAQLAEV
jgi:hypothetical protein